MPTGGVRKAEWFGAALTRVEVSRLDAFGHETLRAPFPSRHASKMGARRGQLIKKQPILRGFGRRLACIGHHGFVSKPRAEADADASGIPRRRWVGPAKRT